MAYYGITQLENGDLGVVVEYCSKGALADALYGEKPRDLTAKQQFRIAHGSACGLAHLHQQNIVHRDVAARNILLHTSDLIPKLSDFGLARQMDDSAQTAEQHTKSTIGPVKWMAPEALQGRSYSKRTDVFAFAVLLFEIFARSPPWPKKGNNIAAALAVSKGERMQIPDSVPEPIRVLMCECWAQDSSHRPSTDVVRNRLGELIDDTDSDSSD